MRPLHARSFGATVWDVRQSQGSPHHVALAHLEQGMLHAS